MSTCRLIVGDVRTALSVVEAGSVQCVVTSPPYWGLRDYGHGDQLGLEATPEEYVANMVEVFREVRRVLRDDGVLWLNLGDSYAGSTMTGGNNGINASGGEDGFKQQRQFNRNVQTPGLKPKDLVGIPWRVAFALQADGWYLRSDVIWHKPNPMPESVTDRPTKAHEYLFLLTKSERYYYDADAIAEDAETFGRQGSNRGMREADTEARRAGGVIKNPTAVPDTYSKETRNARTVWTLATKPFSGAHFATFPPELAEKCIKAGSRPGDTVLDPFGGSGTTAMVATGHGRRAILCELNQEYADLITERVGPILMEAA